VSIVLTIVLIAFCVQGLVKFAVGFLVPYSTRINRIAAYYRRDGRIISIYDSVTLVVIVALIVLLFFTDMQDLSFITGLVVGMLVIQIFFHRFDKPLATERAPESAAPPRKVMSYAAEHTAG
jgi:di/tricarboxylate transporter